MSGQSESESAMIELKSLTRTFGQTMAVDHVSLSIPAGQICGYLGPNGAGKTTTVKMLTGMIRPTEGSASVAGFDIHRDCLQMKRCIGVVPESGALYTSLTPLEYLTFIGRLHGMEQRTIDTRISQFAEFLALNDRLHQRMTEFSKGLKQKVVIAAALIHNPKVLFLDEPLAGLDANTALMLKEMVRNLAREGKTVFYCSHILEVVENLCDRVVILDNGKVQADGSVQELKEMTRRSSLEGVFSRLTHAEDAGELARAFSRSIIQSERPEKA